MFRKPTGISSRLGGGRTNGRFSLLGACALGILLLTQTGCETGFNKQSEAEPTPPPQPEPVLCPSDSVKELEREAIELLDAGFTETARTRLTCALDINPRSHRARLLMEQLDADPRAYLGNRHFIYTVRPNETLSKIAKRYLGSSLKFVILARYNGIDVPSALVAGQRIKVPGTEPVEPPPTPVETTEAPEAVPEPEVTAADLREQALAAEQAGELEKAYGLMQDAAATEPGLENASDDLSRITRNLTAQLEEEAYDQELTGDTDGAIEIWDRILAIDPTNIPAQLAVKRLRQ